MIKNDIPSPSSANTQISNKNKNAVLSPLCSSPGQQKSNKFVDKNNHSKLSDIRKFEMINGSKSKSLDHDEDQYNNCQSTHPERDSPAVKESDPLMYLVNILRAKQQQEIESLIRKQKEEAQLFMQQLKQLSPVQLKTLLTGTDQVLSSSSSSNKTVTGSTGSLPHSSSTSSLSSRCSPSTTRSASIGGPSFINSPPHSSSLGYTANRTPTGDHRSPITGYRTPTGDHRTPTSDHRTPTSDHRTPISGEQHYFPEQHSHRPTPSNHTNVMPSFFLHDPNKQGNGDDFTKSLVIDRSSSQATSPYSTVMNHSANDNINNNNNKYMSKDGSTSPWTPSKEKNIIPNSVFNSNSMNRKPPAMSITDLLATNPKLFESQNSYSTENKHISSPSQVKKITNENFNSNRDSPKLKHSPLSSTGPYVDLESKKKQMPIAKKGDSLNNSIESSESSSLNSTFNLHESSPKTPKASTPSFKRDATFDKPDPVTEAGLDLVPARESESSILPHLQWLVCRSCIKVFQIISRLIVLYDVKFINFVIN